MACMEPCLGAFCAPGWWDGMQPVAGNERLPSDVLCLKDLVLLRYIIEERYCVVFKLDYLKWGDHFCRGHEQSLSESH